VHRFVVLVLLSIVFLGSCVVLGEELGAGDAAHFLRDGLGARGRGMGSAYTALADDFIAPFWNPAPTIQSPSTIVGGGLEQRSSGLFTFSTLGGWHTTKRLILTLAAVSRDIGWTSIRWGSLETVDVDRTAWVNRVGVALAIPLSRGEWTIELDGEFSLRRPPEAGDADYWKHAAEGNVSLGTAFRWAGISIRAGVQRFDVLSPDSRFRPTVGLGIAVGGLVVDLALIPSPLGATYLGGFQVDL